MDKQRDKKGRFTKKDPKDCPYKGREREYKREWYLKNKKRMAERAKRRYQENREAILARVKLWHMENRERVRHYKRKHKDKVRFSGNRELVLARDNNRCRVCESEHQLVVHHIDGTNNRDKMNANNHPDNLLTLCRKCHKELHNRQDEDIVRPHVKA